MPVMDGLTATRRLRAVEQRGSRARVPVIAVTASVIEQSHDACMAAGMDDYVSKPVQMPLLQKLLERLCLAGSESYRQVG